MASVNPSPTLISLETISASLVLTMKKLRVIFPTRDNLLMVARVVKVKKSGSISTSMSASFIKDSNVIKKVLLPLLWETPTKEATSLTKGVDMARAEKWFTFRMEASGIIHTRNISKEVTVTKSW